ncbi:MAG TPA: helix-turn-helix transcriptional regulator [Thermoanaerobaculia bacterium]
MTGRSELGDLFGAHLRDLRLARGYTQADLADRAGLPQTHVSAMERGIKLPNMVTLLRLAVALNCKPAKLMAAFDQADLVALLER